MADVRNLVVVKLRTLGDVLTTFPLLRALKERFPAARLTMVADAAYAELFAAHPRVDEFWPHPAGELRARGGWFALRQHLGFIARLRRLRPDLYLDLYGSVRTAGWGWAAGIPRRLGFDLRGRRLFYTDRIQARHRYVVDLNLQFAERLGWQGQDRRLEFFLTPADRAAARQHLRACGWDEGRPYLFVSPGGGWPVKCWSPERFGEVAGRLARRTGCQVVISGSEGERPLVAACAAALAGPHLPAVDLPLRSLAAVIAGSRLYLGNDSGPKYFAEAFDVPTLICYGPTDFVNNNPVTARRRVAVHDVPCRPCHAERCRRPRRECLDDLNVDEVYAAALRLWEAEPPAK